MDKLLTVGLVISAAAGAATQTFRQLRRDAEGVQKSVAAIGAGRQALERVGKLRDGLAQAQARAEQTHQAVQAMATKVNTAQAAAGRLAGKLADAKAQAALSGATVTSTAQALQLAKDRAEGLRLQLSLAKGAGAMGTAEAGKLRLGLAQAQYEAQRLSGQLDLARRRESDATMQATRMQASLARAEGIAGSLSQALKESERHSASARREVDAVGASLNRAEDNARRLGLRLDNVQQTSQALARLERANNLRLSGQQDIERGKQLRGEAQSGVIEAAAIGYALAKPVSAYARFEDNVKDIAITGEMSRNEEAGLARSIRATALQYNQYQDAVAHAVGTLVAEGMDANTAGRQAGLLAKASTATRAAPEDLARMNVSFHKVFEVEDMALAYSQAAKAGKAGSFELKDMSKWMPELGAYSKAIGLKGNEAVVSLASRLQIAKLGAGSNDAGANNLKNFLGKLTSVDTQKDFRKNLDIDLIGHLQTQAASGKDPISAGIDLIVQQMRKAAPDVAAQMEALSADLARIKAPAERQAELERRSGMIESLGQRAGLGVMFQDMQAVSYILAEIQNRPRLDAMLSDVRTGTGKSGQKVIDEDFDKRKEGTAEQFKALGIASTDLTIAIGAGLAPTAQELAGHLRDAAKWVAKVSDEYPNLVQGIGMAAASFVAFSVARMATKWVAGGALSMVGVGKKALGWMMGAKAAKDVQRVYVVNIGAGGDIGGGGRDTGKGRRGRFRHGVNAARRGMGRAGGAAARVGRAASRGVQTLARSGQVGGIAKGTLRGLGRVALPLGLALAASDAYGALTDPALNAKERKRALGEAAGGMLGGVAGGAVAGAAIGSVVPGIGTAIGAVVGGALGAAGGSRIGGWLADKIDIAPVQRRWDAVKAEFHGSTTDIAATMANWSPLGIAYAGMTTMAGRMGVDLPPNLGAVASNTMTTFQVGLQGGWTQVCGVFDRGLLYINGMASAFAQAGLNLVSGLVNGIRSGLASVEGALTEAASAAVTRFKSVLGIHSPSRVFVGLGGHVSEGAAAGIRGGAGAAAQASSLLAASVIAAASPLASGLPTLAQQWSRSGLPAWVSTANRSGEASGSAPSGAIGLLGGSAGASVVIHYSPQIRLSGVQDGNLRAVQAAVAEATRLSFEEFERHFDRLLADRQRRSYDYGGA